MDLILIDGDSFETDPFEFCIWLKENRPDSRLIFVINSVSKEERDFANQNGVIRYFDKKFPYKQIKDTIDELNSINTINISKFAIFDFIELILLTKMKTLLLIKEKGQKKAAKIYFTPGEIYHAEYANLRGTQSLIAILGMTKFTFSTEDWDIEHEKSITSSFIQLYNDAKRVFGKK
jgi:hypothetical protein